MANARSRSLGTRGKRRSIRRPSTTTEQILSKAGIDLRVLNGRNRSRSGIRDVKRGPLASYLVGGVGIFFLVRFLFRYYQDHPEILTYIRDNFDSIEDRLREFKANVESELSNAKH